jgi:thymidylate kinase
MNTDQEHFSNSTLSRVIAIIGSDGSGKSTLSQDLLLHFQSRQNQQNVELIYLGQSSGNIAIWIKSIPLIGGVFSRFLEKKAARSHEKKETPPDNATVIVIYLLSIWRTHKFRRVLSLSKQGRLVLTDRYPQAQIVGFHFDGPGLTANHASSWLGKKLAAREYRLYQWMASYRPSLVIRLNIDAETAHARKPDHKLSTLREKTAAIPKLHFNGAKILDLSSLDPYPLVLERAIQASEEVLQGN